MDSHKLVEALDGLPLGGLRFFEQIGSTNDEAAHWAESGAPDLALVAADEQICGRGRLGRRWFTPCGAALAFSLVLRPGNDNAGKEHRFNILHLSALGALAISSAFRQQYDLVSQVKWPNDVLLEGRKAAGILVEVQWHGEQLVAAILGIGVNIKPAAVPPEKDLIYPATCVESALGRPVDRLEVLRTTLSQLIEWRARLGSVEFLHAWVEQLAFRGEWVRIYNYQATEAGKEHRVQSWQEGQVLGLEEDGALQLRDQSGKIFAIHTGEIRLRPISGLAAKGLAEG